MSVSTASASKRGALHAGISLDVDDIPSAEPLRLTAAQLGLVPVPASAVYIGAPGPVRTPGKWVHHTSTSAIPCDITVKECPEGLIQLIVNDAYLHGEKRKVRPVWSTHAAMPECAFWEPIRGSDGTALRFVPKKNGAHFFADAPHYLAPAADGTLCLATVPHFWPALSV